MNPDNPRKTSDNSRLIESLSLAQAIIPLVAELVSAPGTIASGLVAAAYTYLIASGVSRERARDLILSVLRVMESV
jgi:hypothetical protein